MRDRRNIIDILWRYKQKENLTAAEQKQLRAWLMASELNEELFDDLSNPAKWNREVEAYGKQNPDAAWQHIQERLNQIPQTGKNRQRKMGWLKYAAAVAALIILALAAYYIFSARPVKKLAQGTDKIQILPGRNTAKLTLAGGQVIDLDRAPDQMQVGGTTIQKKDSGSLIYSAAGPGAATDSRNTLTTPAGGQYQLTLDDGTKVWLNAKSSLTYPVSFAGAARTAQLQGEGYFEIAKNKDKPFRVQLASGFVLVLGTNFNLQAYGEDSLATATLIDGSVWVGGQKDSVLLRPGEQAILAADNSVHAEAGNIVQATAWRHQLFLFHNASYESILRELARWYDIEVIFTSHSGHHFSGLLPRDRPLGELLEILEKEGHVQFSLEGRRLKVSPS